MDERTFIAVALFAVLVGMCGFNIGTANTIEGYKNGKCVAVNAELYCK